MLDLSADGYQEGDTWYRDMRTPGFAGEQAPNSDNSVQWLARKIVADERFAEATVKFWWPAIMGREVAEPPEDESDADFEGLLLAANAQGAEVERLARGFRNGFQGRSPPQPEGPAHGDRALGLVPRGLGRGCGSRSPRRASQRGGDAPAHSGRTGPQDSLADRREVGTAYPYGLLAGMQRAAQRLERPLSASVRRHRFRRDHRKGPRRQLGDGRCRQAPRGPNELPGGHARALPPARCGAAPVRGSRRGRDPGLGARRHLRDRGRVAPAGDCLPERFVEGGVQHREADLYQRLLGRGSGRPEPLSRSAGRSQCRGPGHREPRARRVRTFRRLQRRER